MSLEQSAVATFANHQTFHPRFGWIKKGFDAACKKKDVFNLPDAPVRLGVGKNMVEAIRFWCLATRVLERLPNPERPRMSNAYATGLGEALLGEDGCDPWIEDPTTLWVLHWQAVSAVTMLPVWWSTFNDFTALQFTESELLNFCVDEVASTTWTQPNVSSIAKDVDCLLRMYTAKGRKGRQTIDDLLDSPFRELGLIEPAPSAAGAYRFVRGWKPTLTPAAVAYACLDFMARHDPGAKTVSLTRLTADPGSPGRLLKVGEDVILESLEWAAQLGVGVQVASPAGTSQLLLDREPDTVAALALHFHHKARGRSTDHLPPGALAGHAARTSLSSEGFLASEQLAARSGRRAPKAGAA